MFNHETSSYYIIRESSSRYILKKNDLKGAKLFWETMKNNRK